MNLKFLSDNFLYKRLIFPLSLASLLFLILASFISWQGLFVNLSTTLIGSLITILYIDKVIKKNEQIKWENAQKRINQQIRRVYDAISEQVVIGFNLLKLSDNIILSQNKVNELERDYITRLEEYFSRFDRGYWLFFSQEIESLTRKVEVILDVYGEKIDSDCYSLLLEFNDEGETIIRKCKVGKDILAVPDEKLPVERYGALVVAQYARATTEKEIAEHYRRMIEIAILLQKALQE